MEEGREGWRVCVCVFMLDTHVINMILCYVYHRVLQSV